MDSSPPSPPDSYPPSASWGRTACGLYLLGVGLPAVAAGGLVASLIFLLVWGGIPALLLMAFPPKPPEHRDRVLYLLAIAALYLVFGGFFLYGVLATPSDAQGGLIFYVLFAYAHAAWALLSAPYFIRR